MTEVFSIDDLLTMNTMLLGRGAPNQEDGIGYNKADFGACVNYYEGLSDAQVADLAKRLVKYSKTQLHIDRDLMKATAEYYMMKVTGEFDRADGVSVNVTEDGTLISFRYNEEFVETIKSLPKRRYDGDTKQWIVPNGDVAKTLEALRKVGADVDNALEYIKNNEIIKDNIASKVDILTTFNDNDVLIKFEYNQDIVNEIKKIDKSARKYNPDYKYWTINKEYFKSFMQSLRDVANFKAIKQG